MMNADELRMIYRAYIDCLNARALDRLDDFVDQEVEYNGKRISLIGYRTMLEGDFQAIPDLKFNIGLLCSEPPLISSRLDFDCTPVGLLFGTAVNGKRIQFTENVFYEFQNKRIRRVWSLIDHASIANQCAIHS